MLSDILRKRGLQRAAMQSTTSPRINKGKQNIKINVDQSNERVNWVESISVCQQNTDDVIKISRIDIKKQTNSTSRQTLQNSVIFWLKKYFLCVRHRNILTTLFPECIKDHKTSNTVQSLSWPRLPSMKTCFYCVSKKQWSRSLLERATW